MQLCEPGKTVLLPNGSPSSISIGPFALWSHYFNFPLQQTADQILSFSVTLICSYFIDLHDVLTGSYHIDQEKRFPLVNGLLILPLECVGDPSNSWHSTPGNQPLKFLCFQESMEALCTISRSFFRVRGSGDFTYSILAQVLAL